MKIPHSQYWGLLIDYLKPQWPRVLLIALLLFGSIGLQLVNPLIVRHFIDTARSTEALQKLIQAGLLFIGVGLMHQAVSALSVYVSSDVSWRTTNRLRSDLTLHILGLDISFHSTHTLGELIERVDGDVDRHANFFSQFVMEILGGILLSVGTLIVLFYEDWRLSGILGVLVTVYWCLTIFRVHLMWKQSKSYGVGYLNDASQLHYVYP